MGKIVVIGSSNTDMVIRSQRIPSPGETVLGNEFDIIQGGKGANQAVAAARAGGEVTFIAKVGNDSFGKEAIKGYQKDYINTEHVLTDENHPTGVAIIIVDEATGQNSIVVAPGSNANLSKEEIQCIESIITNTDIVLLQLEIPLEVVEYALEMAHKSSAKTILNPAPAQELANKTLQYVDIITPNETETELLTGLKVSNNDEIIQAAKLLIEKVNEAVIITLGANGVFYQPKNEQGQFIGTKKVKAIDTTAAGDVFNGYFTAAIANGKNIKDAIFSANKAAAYSVTLKGAQPSIPYRTDLNSL